MADVIDALKRLHRLGSKDSAQTAKLKEAACILAGDIARTLEFTRDDLPRGYLLRPGYPVLMERRWADGEIYNVFDTRRAALRFAEDIANGWLDELADWLEQRTGESDGAAATLRRAAEALKPE